MKPSRGEGMRGDWRFWIAGGYVIIVVLLALLWVFALLTPIDEAAEEQQYESLLSVAQVGSELLERSDTSAQDCVASIGTDSIRATLIDATGDVLADSVDDSSQMENHATRTEVAAALAGQTGTDKRTSSTDGVEYLYLAIPASFQGQDVVLRVSVPASEVTEFADTFRTTSSATLLIAVLLAIFVGFYTFKRAAAPVSRLERVRTNFVANASHELKTPVAGIRLLSESIGHACADGDYDVIPVFAKRLDKESRRLQNLVTDLLDLSRIESATSTKVDPSDMADVRSVATTSFEAHAQKAKAKGIDYRLEDDVAENESCDIRLSGADTALIVDNLLENAVNYTESGNVTLRVRSAPKKVILEVEDTGIGIPESEQERIFERFYRVDTARSREVGGTGLGLSLVRHAVNRAGGTVRLKSEVGKGSTFSVTLPKATG